MTADTVSPAPAIVQKPKSTKRRNFLARYMHWLHTMWPAGTVEKLPVVNEDGTTNVPGMYVVGDLTGIPLLKFSSDTGARAVQRIVQSGVRSQGSGVTGQSSGEYDLVIIGAGVSGMAAALEAKKHNLNFVILEASEPFSTIVNFPKEKPIFTYPTDMTPAGDLQFHAQVKEPLVDEIREQTLGRGIKPVFARVERVRRDGASLAVELAKPANGDPLPFSSGELRARRVIIAIGRSGNFRKLGVPGEERGKVFNRLHDPKEFADQDVLVVGGGDSALETAIAIAECGGRVTLSYRKPEFSRPKPDNIEKIDKLMADPMADVDVETVKGDRVNTPIGGFMADHRKPGHIRLMMASTVKEIREGTVAIQDSDGQLKTMPNNAVLTMIGREPPLDFFRKSGVAIHGERTTKWWVTLILSLCIFTFVYHWKKGGVEILPFAPFTWISHTGNFWSDHKWFPHNVSDWWGSLGGAFGNPKNILGTMKVTVGEPGFYYSLAYCTAIVFFGIRRIQRRRTPYVKLQTISLAAFQVIPLFLLPYIVFPWMGYNGWFDSGALKWVADQLFPIVSYGHGREYWRAFGFILAWPLFIWNVFTSQPMWLWLAISLVQTLVIIPAIIYFWGKGAYCGWVCSCGALAETMGDAHRTKMPHGPFWNRFNMVGQVFLWFAVLLLIFRIGGWILPQSFFGTSFDYMLKKMPVFNYVWFVDLLWAGILGVALYWHFSGRVWCRFACPLAALMHIYARFSRFRILADKKKCISCNVCTSVCHQGIDIMNFANKGLPMADPECVRCSACVQMCPTGVLSFGQINRKTGAVIRKDRIAASPVQIREIGVNGKRVAV